MTLQLTILRSFAYLKAGHIDKFANRKENKCVYPRIFFYELKKVMIFMT